MSKAESRAYGASDYAGIQAPGVSFYYGYEHTAPLESDADEYSEGEWCFVAKVGGVQYTIPFSHLETDCDAFECREVVMHGIAYLLGRGILKVELLPPANERQAA